MQAEETRAKEKMAFFKNKVLYCEKNYCTHSVSSVGKKSQVFHVKAEVVFQLIYYSSELLPRKLNRRLTKYLAKTMSFKKTYHCVYSCARPANRLLESVEIGKWHSPVVENPIAQNSDVL